MQRNSVLITIPGPITLTWRGSGAQADLYAGSIYLGCVSGPFGTALVWDARMIGEQSPLANIDGHQWYRTEPEARGALLAAVEKALKENEND